MRISDWSSDVCSSDLYDWGWVREPADIFRLPKKHAADLRKKDGYGDTSVDNLVRAIEQRRTIGFDRFFFSLGIRHVGQERARLVAMHYGTPAAWLKAMDAAQDPEGQARSEEGRGGEEVCRTG